MICLRNINTLNIRCRKVIDKQKLRKTIDLLGQKSSPNQINKPFNYDYLYFIFFKLLRTIYHFES